MVRGRKVTEATGDTSKMENRASAKTPSNALSIKESDTKEGKETTKDTRKQINEETNAGNLKDTGEKAKEDEIVTNENKRVYTLRRSTIVSSRTVPWCQRFPPHAPKSANVAQPKATLSNSNDSSFTNSKSKKSIEKAKNSASKTLEIKKASAKSKGLKLKYLPVSSPYNTLDDEEITTEKLIPKKKKIENGKKRVKVKLTPNVTPQPRPSGDEIATINQQANFQKYLYMGYDYDSCITANADNMAASTSSYLNEFPHHTKTNKRTIPKKATPKSYDDSSDSKQSEDAMCSGKRGKQGNKSGKQSLHSNGEKDSDVSTDSHEDDGRAEKKVKLDVAPLCLKIKVEPENPSSYGRATVEPKDKECRKEKKVRLITPYQILKGKESKPEKPTSIIFKRTTGFHEKQGKSSHDWKGKLVTPSQILKGKVRKEETSFPKSFKRNEVKLSYDNRERYEEDSARRAITGETSTAYLGHRNDDEGNTFYHGRWNESDESCDSDSFDSFHEKRKDFDAPQVSGKYEADTTTVTTSHFRGNEGDEDTEEEREERRAKKKKIKTPSEKKLKKEKKEKAKKRKRKRKEKLAEDEEVVTSSHEERERLNVNTMGR